MIVFNLECKICSVQFEGWFNNSKDFEKQRQKKLINCPSCNSSSIKKSLMAPKLKGTKKTDNSKNIVNNKKIIVMYKIA